MSNENNKKETSREKRLEKAALKAYNESISNKVEPQNHEHNARKEGFARKEEHWNN